MTENARKVFDMLGVEPNERFKIKEKGDALYYLTENLTGNVLDEKGNEFFVGWLLKDTLINPERIIKLPKKKKLRDLTSREFKKWKQKNCHLTCEDCIFDNVCCSDERGWVAHKDLYSDKFLDQEIEVD